MGLASVRAAWLAIVLAAAVVLSACSTPPAGSTTASKVMPEAQAAAQTAASVHVSGSVFQGSQTATIDMSFFAGNSVAGTIGINGETFYVLALNGQTYIKIDAGFLKIAKAPASVCARICGKYVELPAGTASQITGSLSMQELTKQVFTRKFFSDAAASGCVFSPATVNGQSVLRCREGAYTLDVAAHGKPDIVYFSGPNGEHMAFSDWNSVTPPTAPPASQVISLGSLG